MLAYYIGRHHATFTPNNLYTKQLFHQTACTPTHGFIDLVLFFFHSMMAACTLTFWLRSHNCRRPFSGLRVTWHLLHQTPFTPANFYTRHLSHQHFLHQPAFTPLPRRQRPEHAATHRNTSGRRRHRQQIGCPSAAAPAVQIQPRRQQREHAVTCRNTPWRQQPDHSRTRRDALEHKRTLVEPSRNLLEAQDGSFTIEPLWWNLGKAKEPWWDLGETWNLGGTFRGDLQGMCPSPRLACPTRCV